MAWNVLSLGVYIDCPLIFFGSLPKHHLLTKVPHRPSFQKVAHLFTHTDVHLHRCALTHLCTQPVPLPSLFLCITLTAT